MSDRPQSDLEAARLARAWIEGWNEGGSPYDLPLAEDFRHSSPFGLIDGRKPYLDFMKPMIEGGGPALRILRVLGNADEAVVWYEMARPNGPLPCCDWVEVRDGEIASVTAFYDATSLR